MFTLPKGTLVKFNGLPFMLLEDVLTDGLEENYKLALSHSATSDANPAQAETPVPIGQTGHLSDCAVYNAPAYPNGPCDCGHQLRVERRYVALFWCLACNRLLRLGTRYRSWKWRLLHGGGVQGCARQSIFKLDELLAEQSRNNALLESILEKDRGSKEAVELIYQAQQEAATKLPPCREV